MHMCWWKGRVPVLHVRRVLEKAECTGPPISVRHVPPSGKVESGEFNKHPPWALGPGHDWRLGGGGPNVHNKNFSGRSQRSRSRSKGPRSQVKAKGATFACWSSGAKGGYGSGERTGTPDSARASHPPQGTPQHEKPPPLGPSAQQPGPWSLVMWWRREEAWSGSPPIPRPRRAQVGRRPEVGRSKGRGEGSGGPL